MQAQIALVLIGAYLLGAVPFGLVLARIVLGVDPREAGSGNIGATNVARTAGKGLGFITLILDAIKGATPVGIASFLGCPLWAVAGAGAMAVVGHIFPVYLRFKGGKGVATTLGVFLALAPIPSLIAAGVFGVLFAITRTVSFGSLVGALVLVGASVVLDGRREIVVLAALLTVLVFVRHRGNIARIFTGKEDKI